MNVCLELGDLSLSLVPMEAHRQLVLAEKNKCSNPLLVVRSGFLINSILALQFPCYKLESNDCFYVTEIYLKTFRTGKAYGTCFSGEKSQSGL